MKRAYLFLLAVSLQAATFYVSSTGNDANVGSLASPWLTIQGSVNQMHCGDTLNVVANGSYISGDANLPYFDKCTSTTTIQSSNLSLLPPLGTRTNPATDSANYGKLKFATQGILTQTEIHGSTSGAYFVFGEDPEGCQPSSIASNTITIGSCGQSLPAFANGWETSFDLSANLNVVPPSYSTISPFTPGQKLYVVNCMSCTVTGGTYQVSLTLGGSPVTGLTCTGNCYLANQYIGNPLQVTAGSSTWTSPDSLIAWTNGTWITLSATNAQTFGTLPPPFTLDQAYCMANVSGRTFTLALTCGGTPIVVTGIGSGSLAGSSANVANNWAFRGIEATDSNNGVVINSMFYLGSGWESSTKVGNPNHFEFDHIWCHDLVPGEATPPGRCIQDNATYVSVHDSYISGMLSGESQAIAFCGAAGPTEIKNNMLEAGGENTIAGGCTSASGTANKDILFTENYYLKPVVWKTSSGTTAPSGNGLYNCDDPNHCGGEWYLDTSTMQQYQVNASGVWATTGSSPSVPGGAAFIDLAEHKNGQNLKYIGNVMNGSWVQRQSGEAFNNAGEVNSGPSAGGNAHIIVMHNAIYNVFQMMTGRQSYCTLSLSVLPCTVLPGDHETVNNLIVGTPFACAVPPSVSTSLCGANPFQNGWNGGNPISFQGDLQAHNSLYLPDSGYGSVAPAPMFTASPTGGNPPFPQFTMNLENFQNNLEVGDFQADSVNSGNALLYYYSNSTFTNNALKAATGSYANVGTPQMNSWANFDNPMANSNIGWVNATGTIVGDYHLACTSAYAACNGSATRLSTDGTDLGADIDMVTMMTSGAIAGTPPWDIAARLNVEPYSTSVIFRYQAPTSGVCTATLYNAPARISGNQVASVADSAAASVSAGLDRQIVITGLTAGTQYWPKLSCGGGVLMIGIGGGTGIASFTTKAAGSGTYNWQFGFNASTAMRYSIDPTFMTGVTTLGAATNQTVPVTHAQVTAYAQVGTTGPVTIIGAP